MKKATVVLIVLLAIALAVPCFAAAKGRAGKLGIGMYGAFPWILNSSTPAGNLGAAIPSIKYFLSNEWSLGGTIYTVSSSAGGNNPMFLFFKGDRHWDVGGFVPHLGGILQILSNPTGAIDSVMGIGLEAGIEHFLTPNLSWGVDIYPISYSSTTLSGGGGTTTVLTLNQLDWIASLHFYF